MRCDAMERNVSQMLPALGGLGETEGPVKECVCEVTKFAKLATQGHNGGCTLRLCGGGEGIDVAAAGRQDNIDMYGDGYLDGAGRWARAAAHARLMKRAAAPSFSRGKRGRGAESGLGCVIKSTGRAARPTGYNNVDA